MTYAVQIVWADGREEWVSPGVDRSPMSDFRFCYSADFEVARTPQGAAIVKEDEDILFFILRAVKNGS